MIFNLPHVQATLNAIAVLGVGDVVQYIGTNHEIPDKMQTRITGISIDDKACEFVYTIFESGACAHRKDLLLLRKALQEDLDLVLTEAVANAQRQVQVKEETSGGF